MTAIASEAGVSRTTLYRSYMSRDHVALALVQREVARFRAALEAGSAAARTLDELVVAGATLVAEAWADGTFPEIDLYVEGTAAGRPGVPERVVTMPTEVITPHVARVCGVSPPIARRVAEWIVRTVLSYLLVPSAEVDLRDPASVRRLVRRFILPTIPAEVSR